MNRFISDELLPRNCTYNTCVTAVLSCIYVISDHSEGGGPCHFLMRANYGGKISQGSYEAYYCSWVVSVMGNDLSLYIVADKAIFGKVLTVCYDWYQVYYFLIGLLFSSWETGHAIFQAGSWF